MRCILYQGNTLTSLTIPYYMIFQMAVLVSTLLSAIVLSTKEPLSLPPVSYIKAIDIWTLICFFFIMAAIAVVVVQEILNSQSRVFSDIFNCIKGYVLVKCKAGNKVTHVKNVDLSPKQGLDKKAHKPHLTHAQKLDVLARIFFPVAFMILCVSYWSYYRKT